MNSISLDSLKKKFDLLRLGDNPKPWRAMLFVLINGFLISFIIFVALDFYTNQMNRGSMRHMVAESYAHVTRNIESFEQTLKATGILVTRLDAVTKEDVAAVIQNVPGIEKFDQLSFVTNGSAGIDRLTIFERDNDWHGEKTVTLDQVYLKKLLQLSKKMPGWGDNQDFDTPVLVFSDVPGEFPLENRPNYILQNSPFVIAVPVSDQGKHVGIVVGVTSIKKIVPLNHLISNRSLYNISIDEAGSDIRLFQLQKRLERAEEKSSTSAIDIGLGYKFLRVEIEAIRDAQSVFLERVPMLTFVAGMLISFILAFFVWLHQKKSNDIAGMNRALEQKNQDMINQAQERERLNRILTAAQKEYKAIIDGVSDIIFEVDDQGRFVFVNQTWVKLTGLDEKETYSMSLFDVILPKDMEGQKAEFDLLVKGEKQPYITLTKLKTRDGGYRSIEINFSMVRKNENRDARISGTIKDIEDKARAERALDETEKKYRTIVENAAGGIYQITREGQFLSANPSMARILGYDTPTQLMEDVYNAHEQLYVVQKDRALLSRLLDEDNNVEGFETRLKTRSGEEIWVNINARAVRDDDDNILYYEGSMANISARKLAEEELREAKLQSDMANRAKTEFLANMSHELRTPLNSIIGFSEIIKNEVLGPVANKQYSEYAQDIYESGKNLLHVINEILDVSQIDAGERSLQESNVDMSFIIESCVRFLASKATHVELLNRTKNVPSVLGEETALKQIILNLLSNALKFTSEGGRVTIGYETDDNGQLLISFTDTGVGLDEAEIEKALSPFGQVDTSLDRSGSGAGLGLTLTDSLMKLHGGRLELFSQKGIGTTATLIFPVDRVIKAKEKKAKS